MNQYTIDSFKQQLRKDPSSRVFFRLAEEYRKGGVYEDAIDVCLKGIKHHPRYLPARVCLGRCRQALGQLNQAEDDYKDVLNITPDNPHALQGLASIYFETGRLDEAKRFYETLALHDPFDEGVSKRLNEIATQQANEEAGNALEAPPLPPEEALEDLEEISPETDFVTEEDPELFADEDLELVNEDMVHDFDTGDGRDSIDIEFDKAIEEDVAVNAFEDLAEASPDPVSSEPTPLTPNEENELTKGLKHEKMEHYEAAQKIYRTLLVNLPGNPSVMLHLNRVEQLIASENGNRKKIRLLSNWLDKIKGVYYVS